MLGRPAATVGHRWRKTGRLVRIPNCKRAQTNLRRKQPRPALAQSVPNVGSHFGTGIRSTLSIYSAAQGGEPRRTGGSGFGLVIRNRPWGWARGNRLPAECWRDSVRNPGFGKTLLNATHRQKVPPPAGRRTVPFVFPREILVWPRH